MVCCFCQVCDPGLSLPPTTLKEVSVLRFLTLLLSTYFFWGVGGEHVTSVAVLEEHFGFVKDSRENRKEKYGC